METIELLRTIRKGFALATSEQMDLVSQCQDLEVIDGNWTPRWALEAVASLRQAGCTVSRIRELFSLGSDAVRAELAALVRLGKLEHTLHARDPYNTLPIDIPTKLALTAALQQHRETCAGCGSGNQCAEGAELHDELGRLFPIERRRSSR